MQTTLKRCVGANDEMCKFPECHCAQTGLIGLPVIDIPFMDSQLKCDLPIEMIEPVKSVKVWTEHLKTAALVIAAMLALACTFYVSSI